MKFAQARDKVSHLVAFNEYEKRGGLEPDYQGILDYNSEWYSTVCPEIEYIELDREAMKPMGEVAALWGESVGATKQARTVKIHAYPKMDGARRQNHTKTEMKLEQAGEVFFGVGVLKAHDLYPQQGDHIRMKGYRYEILEVMVKPEDEFGLTNLPITVTARVSLHRIGDNGIKPEIQK